MNGTTYILCYCSAAVIAAVFFYNKLHWINRIFLLSLEPLAGELKYASVVWSAAGAWAGWVSNV
jgi:hypothetical protein